MEINLSQVVQDNYEVTRYIQIHISFLVHFDVLFKIIMFLPNRFSNMVREILIQTQSEYKIKKHTSDDYLTYVMLCTMLQLELLK